jgi:hypothetical protein
MLAISWRARWLASGAPSAASALPKVSSPDSTCIGAHEPPLGVPSISRRASVCDIRRCQVAGRSSQHGARHHAAHGMRQQAHRLAGGFARVQRGVHAVGQAARFFFDGAAPVKGKLDHLVGGRQVLGQVVVDHADGAVGLHVGRPGLVGQLVQAADEAQAQPDALVAKRQVAAQDARQHAARRGGAVRLLRCCLAARTLDDRHLAAQDSGPMGR